MYQNIIPFLKAPSGGGFTGLLDTYGNAYIARSVARRLSSTYTGSLIRIRRSSDNTEQDIGYNGSNELDQSAITSFVGSNSAYVVKMYDQSGNGRDWIQATSSKQPRIVNAGTIDTVNSKPAAYYDGSDDDMGVSSLSGEPSSCQVFSVIKINKDNIGFYNGQNSGSSQMYFGVFINGSSSVPDQFSGTITYYKNGSSISATRDAMYDNFINVQGLLTMKGVNLATADWATVHSIHDSYGSSFSFGGYLQEDIIYNDQSNSQSGVESNINSFYAIF